MNSRDRFQNIMGFLPTDRPPLFEDGIREEVLRTWRTQGLKRAKNITTMFSYDKREEIEPNLEPLPTPTYWPKTLAGLKKFSQRLDPDFPERLPGDWDIKIKEWQVRDFPLILRVHRGYFLAMGVNGWHRFTDAIQLLVDDPSLVTCWMEVCAELSAKLADKILQDVDADAALFSEPIGGNHGPLISPKMYTSFVISSYRPILQVLKKHGVKTIIYRTYANTRALLPTVVEAGFTCLWACESDPRAMDYRDIRREFGNELRLIGGIDADSLRQDKKDIYRSVMEIVPGLLEAGGFIPLADGRVREDVSFDNYVYYRQLLESVTAKQ